MRENFAIQLNHVNLGKNSFVRFKSKPLSKPDASDEAGKADSDTKKEVEKGSQEQPFFDEAVDLHFKGRKGREGTEKADDNCHSQVVADLPFIGQ